MTADEIAHCLARNLFKSDLVVVDRCTWPGSECDLLVVTPRLQCIDVEIKVSRADLKADRDKSKWFMSQDWLGLKDHGPPMPRNLRLEWPRRIWKHYYAMPAALWKAELAEYCNPKSGVITVDVARPESSVKRRATMAARSPAEWHHAVVRRARPRPDYVPLADKALQAVARLASLRMWDAYHEVTRVAADYRAQIAVLTKSEDVA